MFVHSKTSVISCVFFGNILEKKIQKHMTAYIAFAFSKILWGDVIIVLQVEFPTTEFTMIINVLNGFITTCIYLGYQ